MSQRLIREDMLDSERVQRRSVEARWLFVATMLIADDMGLLELGEFKLSRRASLPEKRIPALLAELVDADLLRPYEVAGKRYAFIPRFGQRLRVKRAKNPLPPEALMQDDVDALNKINDLQQICQTDVRTPLTDASKVPPNAVIRPPEPEPEPEGKNRDTSAGKQPTTPAKKARAPKPPKEPAPSIPACPHTAIVALYHEKLPNLPAVAFLEGPMWDKRVKAMNKVWKWVMTSKLRDGTRRAETVEQGLDWFGRYYDRATQSDFIMGRGKRPPEHAGWRATFDFLLQDNGLAHVVENTQ